MIRKQTTSTLIDDGPVVFELPAQDPTFAIAASEATQDISYTYDVTMDWATEDGAFMFLFSGKPQNPQRNFFAGPWRITARLSGVDPGPLISPIATESEYAIAEGQRIWCYGRISRADGRISLPFRDSVLVGA
ncbi:hypothetical protein KAR91_05285 [Candidatus Pacearchaeota archaeon]|nr:hypothetical protein [Candidatus Pacearchaeota archaeon]